VLGPSLVFVDGFEQLLSVRSLVEWLEECVAEEDEDCCNARSYQITQVISKSAELAIPFVFVCPEINKLWRYFERKGHQSITSRSVG
jgi:hypothetical protein